MPREITFDDGERVRVSASSANLPGEIVSVVGGVGQWAAHARVRTRSGGVFKMPPEFLEKLGPEECRAVTPGFPGVEFKGGGGPR